MLKLTYLLMWAGGIGFTMVVKIIKDRQSRNDGITPELQERLKRLKLPPQKSNEELLEDYRLKFRLAPLGIWSAVVGTASILMDERWTFLPDGTGSCEEYGCFGASQGIMLFEWKSVGDFHLLCKVTKEAWEDYPSQDEDWEPVDYSFQVVETDCGSRVAMCNVRNDVVEDHFWSSRFALGYSGPSILAEQSPNAAHPAT